MHSKSQHDFLGSEKLLKPYQVCLADPPWHYYGDPNKMGAAGKEYSLMSIEDIQAIPVKSLLAKNAAVFCWATCPRLDVAIETLKAWGLHYRGVAYVWVKTRKSDDAIIHGQGVPPTFTKPTTELLLVATTKPRGRPFKIHKMNQPQVVLAPRGRHSEKPEVFRHLIDELCGDVTKLEMFARKTEIDEGWDYCGDEAPRQDLVLEKYEDGTFEVVSRLPR